MERSGKHVAAFSPKENLFALINTQGVLCIWDVLTNELKQEYKPYLDLFGSYTALTWILVTTQNDKEKKVCTGRTNEQLFLALGSNNGKVHLYSYTEARIVKTFESSGHNGRISAMTVDDSGNLYSCGNDCQVIVWSLNDQRQIGGWFVGPEKPYSLEYSKQSDCLIVGSYQLKVYSKDTNDLLQTFTGHNSEITAIATVQSNQIEYILTTAKLERAIYVWKMGKKKRQNENAICSLLMEDVAHSLCCKVDEDGNIVVSSVARNGIIHIYSISSENVGSHQSLKPRLTIELASDSATVIEPIPAVASSLFTANSPHKLLIGYGDKRVLVFEKVALNYSEKMQVLVRTDPKKKYLSKLEEKKAKIDKATKTQTPIVNSEKVDYKSVLNVSKKSVLLPDMPMESRLKNMNLNGANTSGPQPASKARLLIQALHGKDKELLRSVLSTKDEKIVKLTLQKLPVQYVHPLVDELTIMMQQTRQNVEYATVWLKFLTQMHSSQLMALGPEELQAKFGPCIGIIEHRMNCLQEVMKVSGRLELLISQIERNIKENNEKNDDVLIYEDNDSADSEIENDDSKSSTDELDDEDDDESIGHDEENIEDDGNKTSINDDVVESMDTED